MESTTIAIDLAKTVFEVVVSNPEGGIVERRRLSRGRLMPYLAEHQPAVVVMEACGSAHFWARQLQPIGHTPRLLPPSFVRPWVVRNKTDRADAMALLQAHRHPEVCAVPVKTEAQQELTSLHRLRSGWMATRTARINSLRGLLREFGVNIPQGAHRVVRHVRDALAGSQLPEGLKPILTEALAELGELDRRIGAVEDQLERLAANQPAVQRLRTIPGIGLLTATALVACVGNPQRFPSGRRLASFLGLTPREHSSGSHRRLGRISKRGDAYLRSLLLHGARSVLLAAKRRKQPDQLAAWALQREQQRGHNKAATALANKLARVAWAVWSRQEDYQP
jgi:transposase